MPVRVVGMIGVAPSADDATVHVIDGGVSGEYLVEFSQAHDRAGFDLVLVGYTSTSADGWAVATHAAAHTEQLGYLIAHRPGFVAPTLAARKAATFDQLSQGRFALHIIAGASDRDQQRDGDFLSKVERYERAGEYIDIMRRTWTASEPFDFDGTHYSMRDVRSDVQPFQSPAPPVFLRRDPHPKPSPWAPNIATSTRCSPNRWPTQRLDSTTTGPLPLDSVVKPRSP